MSVNDLRVGIYDRRRKLTDEDRECIIAEYMEGSVSQTELAHRYGVSCATICFLVNPAAKRKHDERNEEYGNRYNTTERRRENMRQHREYKRTLRKQGKI